MVKGPPSVIYYAAGPDGGPPEMDPPLYAPPPAKKEAAPAPPKVQGHCASNIWYPVAEQPKPVEEFPRYLPDWDGGPPCGGRVPVKAVPIPPDYDCSNVATCGTSCCGTWCDAPPPVLKKKAAPKKAPPPPAPLTPCSPTHCSTCPTTPCSECSPKPEPEKIVVKVKRTNRADVPKDPNMQYLGPDSAMTSVHMIHGEHKPWDHPGVEFDFSKYEIDSGVTIRTLIKRLGIPEGSGVCECVELGNGRWIQAASYVPVDKKAFVAKNKEAFAQLDEEKLKGIVLGESCDQTLEEVGWEGKLVWLLPWK